MFSLLFSDPDILRGLYGALEGVELAPDVPVSINTLTDVIFKDQINDLSFTVDNRLVVLLEHQSTINPNMPNNRYTVISGVCVKRKLPGSTRSVEPSALHSAGIRKNHRHEKNIRPKTGSHTLA